jgi:Skp family chaperone for outer membrane proteins
MRQGSTQQEADVEKTLAIHQNELRERIVRSIQRAHKGLDCSNLVGVCSCSLVIEIVRETK